MAKQVVIIGRLVSLTRAEARQAIAQSGGEFSDRVTRSTGIVVLGARGPHFQPNGRPLLQLARARRMVQEGQTLEIWQEDTWLESLGLFPASDGVRKRFTAGQIVETLQISRATFDRWLAYRLVRPLDDSGPIPLFDFQQVTAARTLAELGRGGVRLTQIKKAVAQLAQWLPSAEIDLTDLSLAEDARRIIVRTPNGSWAEPSGQLLLDFDADKDCEVVSLARPETQSEAFDRALACEDERPQEAAAIYRQIIAEHGAHPTLAFNLGNALYAADDLAGAVVHYRQATELAPQHAGAWNNLANVLAELNQLEEALDAYRRALSINPRLADARFNLAQTLIELGRRDESVLHWRAYLANDTDSSWADYARDQLES
jgi:tetratricopeptide (TPR) repeat protein